MRICNLIDSIKGVVLDGIIMIHIIIIRYLLWCIVRHKRRVTIKKSRRRAAPHQTHSDLNKFYEFLANFLRFLSGLNKYYNSLQIPSDLNKFLAISIRFHQIWINSMNSLLFPCYFYQIWINSMNSLLFLSDSIRSE